MKKKTRSFRPETIDRSVNEFRKWLVEHDNAVSHSPVYLSELDGDRLCFAAKDDDVYPTIDFIREHLYRDRNLDDLEQIIYYCWWMEMDHLEWWIKQTDKVTFKMQYLFQLLVTDDDPKEHLLPAVTDFAYQTKFGDDVVCANCGDTNPGTQRFDFRARYRYYSLQVPARCFCEPRCTNEVEVHVMCDPVAGYVKKNIVIVNDLKNGSKTIEQRVKHIQQFLQ